MANGRSAVESETGDAGLDSDDEQEAVDAETAASVPAEQRLHAVPPCCCAALMQSLIRDQ